MAARAAVQAPQRVQRLVLLAPAAGYGNAEPALREQKLRDRLANLERLGPAGHGRSSARRPCCRPLRRAELVDALSRQSWRRSIPAGYTQAARLLAARRPCRPTWRTALPGRGGQWQRRQHHATPASCQAVAQAAGVALDMISVPVGHACPLEAAGAVNALLGLN